MLSPTKPQRVIHCELARKAVGLWLSLGVGLCSSLPSAVQGQPEEGATAPLSPAATARPLPGSARALRLLKLEVPPEIDGRLDDPVWRTAPFSGGFWMTDQQRWPNEITEVSVIADERTLYVAFRAYDSRPEAIQSIETVRDRRLGLDDQVAVEIDAFGDHKGTSVFRVNSRGTQDDSIAGGRATNIEWKGDWAAAAVQTDFGWTAEMAIPFEILNYRTSQTSLLINFIRYHHRTRQWSKWADVTPQNKKEEMGRLLDVRLPDRTETANWTVMPYLLAGKHIQDRHAVVQDRLVTGGLDLRYAPRSNLTGLLSLNPDFTQVERQITDANFSYTEKSVRDARVFFQEGAEYYGDDERIFYSPRVPDFDGGAKLFGQSGTFRYAAFASSAPDDRADGLVRVSIAPNATHAVAFTTVATERTDLTGSTTAITAEGRERVGSFWSVDLVQSDNETAALRETATMGEIEAGWRGDYFSAGIGYDDYDTLFSPANGLIKNDRLGTNRRSAFMGYYRSFGMAAVSEAAIDVVGSLRKTADGRTQNRTWYLGGSVEWRQFLRTSLAVTRSDYRPTSALGPGLFADQMNQDEFWTVSIDFNTHSSRVGYGLSASSGELGGGDYGYDLAYLWARPTPGTSISFTAERLESFGVVKQYVVEAGWDITEINSLVFRYISLDDQPYRRVGYRRVVRDGLDIFLLYDREPLSEAEISLKLLWTF